jgi:hypothetical protein
MHAGYGESTVTTERTRLCVAFAPETVAFLAVYRRFVRTSRPYSVRPSAIHILLLLRRARRIHHDYKEQKQSIKDKGERYKRAFLSLLEMSFLNMFGDSNIVLLYLDQTACNLIQFNGSKQNKEGRY